MFNDCNRFSIPKTISKTSIPIKHNLRLKENFPLLTPRQEDFSENTHKRINKWNLSSIHTSTTNEHPLISEEHHDPSNDSSNLSIIDLNILKNAVLDSFPNGLTPPKGEDLSKTFALLISRFKNRYPNSNFTLKNLSIKTDQEEIFLPFFKAINLRYPNGINNEKAIKLLQYLQSIISKNITPQTINS